MTKEEYMRYVAMQQRDISAVDVSLNKVEQEPCKTSTDKPMTMVYPTIFCDDAISREDVLNLAKKGVLVSNGNYESVCKAINELPSVQPKPIECDDVISREKVADMLTELVEMVDTGSQRDLDRADELSRQIISAIKPCNDTISREDKKHIDGFKYWCETNEENGTITMPKFVCDEIVKILDKFSSVTPSRRKGHWIEVAQYSDGKHKIECSECGNHIFDRGHANSHNVKEKYKFCPNCGADMRGDTE